MLQKQQTLTINIPGFTFYDLSKPEKLADLTRIFNERIRNSSPALWQAFSSYKESGD